MKNPFNFLSQHKYLMYFLIFAVVISTAIVSRIPDWQAKKQVNAEIVKTVSLISASDFLKNKGNISANGIVESMEQAELRSQVSSPVTRVHAKIGQKVSAGQVLVSLQNNDLSAQYNQAMAVVKSQQARLDELKKGARTEELKLAEIQVESAKQTLKDVTAQQETNVKNAYSALLNAGISPIANKGNQPGGTPIISGTYTGNNEGQLEITIYSAGGLNFQVKGLVFAQGVVSTSPVKIGDSGLYIQFTDTSVSTFNSWTVLIPNKQSVAYTSANNAYQAALEGKDFAINSAQNALKSAEQALAIKIAGASNEQIKAQEAAVEQAQASAAVIAAQISKTIIRSPITGTVSDIPVKYGELVSPGQLVASVVSKGALQIKAFISDYDLPYIQQDQIVNIGETATGTITNISPSVDPTTKNVQIQIAVSQPDEAGLVVGQSVEIKIVNNADQNEEIYQLPLQAVRVDGNNYSVLVVNNNLIEAKEVEVANVKGETIEIKKGLSPDMKIISPVYELKIGQKVNVNE